MIENYKISTSTMIVILLGAILVGRWIYIGDAPLVPVLTAFFVGLLIGLSIGEK